MDEAKVQALIAAALAEFGKTTIPGLMTAAVAPLGEQMKGISDVLGKLTPAQAPPAAAPPAAAPPAQAPPAGTPGAGLSPEANAIILEMKRTAEAQAAQIKALTDKNVTAEKKADESERASVINAALAGFQFASDSARATATSLITAQVKRTEAGQLIAGDNLTPEAFIKDFLPNQHAYLLAPTNVGGGGITPGTSAPGAGKGFDLDAIKPGMSAEQKSAAFAAVAAALPRSA